MENDKIAVLIEALQAISTSRPKDYLTAHNIDTSGPFEDRIIAVARHALATIEGK